MASLESKATHEIECIRRAQQGDSEAFGPLVQRHQQRIFSIVFHLVRRRDEVEDLAKRYFSRLFAPFEVTTFSLPLLPGCPELR